MIQVTGIADWKDTDEIIRVITVKLAKMGIIMKDHPSVEGSDQYMFVLMTEGTTRDELKIELKEDAMIDLGFDEDDMDDDSSEDKVNRLVDSYCDKLLGPEA